ncbi:TMEM175 family protein [Streptococcus ratti]|uniref:DUF1211 domain-containing protein n=1 Tax=Streptococcus ratti TaxID=1341 RepID=A0A7X9LF61_STRRT|nr:TMEM175 family protein [Streptococcus ratti]NMD50025.1 DUF1211 domain-containing protein [Streptococcus ratti]
MNKERFEAFTDAIVAIVVTILVLELPKPENATLEALLVNWQSYLVYISTFVVLVGVWYQHHNLFFYAKHINYKVFWANAFWLLIQSFFPYVSAWLAEFPNRLTPFLVFIILNILWTLSYRVMYYALREINDMPVYPWTRTLSYILIMIFLLLLALWNIPMAIIGLIVFNASVLMIKQDIKL